jgi:hypothetical protein
MATKIELREVEDLHGKIWYNLWINDWCEKTYPEDKRADALVDYGTAVERVKNGYPKTTVLYSETI